MHMIDFEYNGELLSDYECMICSFDGTQDTIDIANSITINTVKTPNANKYMAVGSSYEDVLTVQFSICTAYVCDGVKTVESVMTDEKINEVMRWLNRRGFYKFVPIYDDESFENVFFYGSFNAELVKSGNDVVGFNLTLKTNAPYGYMETPSIKHTFKGDDFALYDVSDEIGLLYVNATIKCLEDGNLTIKNKLDPLNSVTIKNCKANEIITLKGEQKIITTSNKSHLTLFNDFNYRYIRIKNTYDNSRNIFTSSINCEITIDYYPIRKVGIII